jgi:AbrB family looped-hinge helix DNA binding protein
MKLMRVPIDRAGRVVLPKQVREELDIRPGDRLAVTVVGGEVTLRPDKHKGGLIRKGTALVFSTGGGDVLERGTVERIIEEEREQRINRLLGNFTGRKRSS